MANQGMKEKLTAVMTQKVSPVFQKLGGNKYLKTISASMMGTLTPIIIGSIAILLNCLPIPAFKEMLNATGLTDLFRAVNSLTIGSMAMYVAFLMAKNQNLSEVS